jgi:hyperosmotically inducible protein
MFAKCSINQRILAMKKIMILMISILLIVGAAACTGDAGNRQADTRQSGTSSPGQVQQESAQMNEQSTQAAAGNTIRADQLESDARARSQREDALGDNNQLRDSDLADEVRRKLEDNVPVNQLTINESGGAVTISGTVPTQEQLNMIEPLAREVNGVESVEMNVVVSPS